MLNRNVSERSGACRGHCIEDVRLENPRQNRAKLDRWEVEAQGGDDGRTGDLEYYGVYSTERWTSPTILPAGFRLINGCASTTCSDAHTTLPDGSQPNPGEALNGP